MGPRCKICMLLSIVSSVVLSILLYQVLNYNPQLPEMKEDGWWGPGERKEEKETGLRKVVIKIPDIMLTDLKNRLKNTRFQTDLEEGDFNYGFQASYMKEVVKYWSEKYDWRKAEVELNKFENYKTLIEGVDVHYLHIKPDVKDTIPLLMVHGWPGSIYEFHKIIPLLTDASQDIVFEVICPSIPGYGFSDTPKKKGFDQIAAARIFMKLMKKIGIDKYYIQGGDWGALIIYIMAQAYPQHVLGMHSNLFSAPVLPKTILKQLVGGVFPSLLYNEDERAILPPVSKMFNFLVIEGGYFHIQATRPDTVAMGLTDSPVGLAAYIMEKFGAWTNPQYKNRTDGGITQKFTLDELLTNVMIYWTNQNIVSSMRFYKECFLGDCFLWANAPVHVPAALAQSPYEMAITPRALAADRYTDIVQYTVMPRGGHFAAFEEPHLLYNDIKHFIRTLKSRQSGNKV